MKVETWYFNCKQSSDLAKGIYKFNIVDDIDYYVSHYDYSKVRYDGHLLRNILSIEIFFSIIYQNYSKFLARKIFEEITRTGSGYDIYKLARINEWCEDFEVGKPVQWFHWENSEVIKFFEDKNKVMCLVERLDELKKFAREEAQPYLDYGEAQWEAHPNHGVPLRNIDDIITRLSNKESDCLLKIGIFDTDVKDKITSAIARVCREYNATTHEDIKKFVIYCLKNRIFIDEYNGAENTINSTPAIEDYYYSDFDALAQIVQVKVYTGKDWGGSLV